MDKTASSIFMFATLFLAVSCMTIGKREEGGGDRRFMAPSEPRPGKMIDEINEMSQGEEMDNRDGFVNEWFPDAETEQFDEFDPDNSEALGQYSQACTLPLNAGNRHCSGMVTKYYNDKDTGECKPFGYTGCGGNANRFNSKMDCILACQGAPVNPQPSPSVCNEILRIGLGHCSNRKPGTRWFYNGFSKNCEAFQFEGCAGDNENNFKNLQQCNQVCGGCCRPYITEISISSAHNQPGQGYVVALAHPGSCSQNSNFYYVIEWGDGTEDVGYIRPMPKYVHINHHYPQTKTYRVDFWLCNGDKGQKKNRCECIKKFDYIRLS